MHLPQFHVEVSRWLHATGPKWHGGLRRRAQVHGHSSDAMAQSFSGQSGEAVRCGSSHQSGEHPAPARVTAEGCSLSHTLFRAMDGPCYGGEQLLLAVWATPSSSLCYSHVPCAPCQGIQLSLGMVSVPWLPAPVDALVGSAPTTPEPCPSATATGAGQGTM